MIGCETTMLLRSHPIVAIWPLGFRHYNKNNIYRAVQFLTLCLRTFAVSSVAVLDVAVPIGTSFGLAQAYSILNKVIVTFCKTYKILLPQISPNQVESTHTLPHNHCSKVGK